MATDKTKTVCFCDNIERLKIDSGNLLEWIEREEVLPGTRRAAERLKETLNELKSCD